MGLRLKKIKWYGVWDSEDAFANAKRIAAKKVYIPKNLRQYFDCNENGMLR